MNNTVTSPTQEKIERDRRVSAELIATAERRVSRRGCKPRRRHRLG